MAGELLWSFAQVGSAAMLMTFMRGGVPSSRIVPVIEPAVAASTAVAEELAAGVWTAELPCLLPQLTMPAARNSDEATMATAPNVFFMSAPPAENLEFPHIVMNAAESLNSLMPARGSCM